MSCCCCRLRLEGSQGGEEPREERQDEDEQWPVVVECEDCEVIPAALAEKLNALALSGVSVLYLDGKPERTEEENTLSLLGKVVAKEQLPMLIKKEKWTAVETTTAEPDLRVLHRADGETQGYFFFNASLERAIDTCVKLPSATSVVAYDAWQNRYYQVEEQKLILAPGQAILWCVTAEKLPVTDAPARWEDLSVEKVTVTLHQQEETVLQETCEGLPNKNYAKDYPTFSGIIDYDFVCNAANSVKWLKLNRVGETARLWVNGVDCGFAVRAPYVFSVENAWRAGENQIRIEVAVNQAYGRRDRFSTYAILPPMGLFGAIEASTEFQRGIKYEYRGFYACKVDLDGG